MSALTPTPPVASRQLPERFAIQGIPETMLWTLHNRAAEAMRPDAWLDDTEAVRIYRSIDYDFHRQFGTPDGSHAIRSVMFDEGVRAWLNLYPQGTVVELACGLETQCHRTDNGQLQWVCVDLPEAIAIRERFLMPSDRCKHIRKNALDVSWMDGIDRDQPVFISMQGLLMYFTEAQVRSLLTSMLDHFAHCTLMFDTIPRWFSRKTLAGFWKTPHYRTPPMPWGINRHEIEPLLRGWQLPVSRMREEPYRKFRVFPWDMASVFAQIPWLGTHMPTVVHLTRTAT